MEACAGFDPNLSLEAARTWNEGKCIIRGREVVFNPKSITQAMFLKNEGKEIRNSKLNKMVEVENFKGKKHPNCQI